MNGTFNALAPQNVSVGVVSERFLPAHVFDAVVSCVMRIWRANAAVQGVAGIAKRACHNVCRPEPRAWDQALRFYLGGGVTCCCDIKYECRRPVVSVGNFGFRATEGMCSVGSQRSIPT